MRKKLLLGVVVVLCTGTILWAGQVFRLHCPDKDCAFEGSLMIGGGRMFEQATGYCVKCQKFVVVSWPRKGSRATEAADKSKPDPKPIGQVWNPASGKVDTLYRCPTCEGPFIAIRQIGDLEHCPKCGKSGLEHERGAIVD